MKVAFYIAKRYLFSKKSTNVINIISGISMFGIGIGALALVIVLSAFNGLEELVGGLYSSFDPEIKITAEKGKTFNITEQQKEKLSAIDEVNFVVEVLQENVLLKYGDAQTIATLKGVEDSFQEMTQVDSMIVEGSLNLKSAIGNHLVIGYGIAYNLGVFINSGTKPITIFAPKRTGKVSLNPEKAFKRQSLMPSGIFAINPDFDYKYALAPINFVREIFDYNKNEVSALELGIKNSANASIVKSKIQTILGEGFTVKTRYELNEIIFKTNNTEKWITFLILSFILVIATFNVIGSLTMLILDKQKDITILKSMGASKKLIEHIFILEGLLISIVGGVSGILIGGLLCFLQKNVGLIRLSGTIVEYYPIKMIFTDFVMVFATVVTIGFIAAIIPAKIMVKKSF